MSHPSDLFAGRYFPDHGYAVLTSGGRVLAIRADGNRGDSILMNHTCDLFACGCFPHTHSSVSTEEPLKHDNLVTARRQDIDPIRAERDQGYFLGMSHAGDLPAGGNLPHASSTIPTS